MSHHPAFHRPEETPLAAGTHLATPRRGFVHHGLYVGDGRVIHYRGFDRLLRRHPVQEVSLTTFAGGRGFSVVPCAAPRFDTKIVVARARSRLGEDRYRLWSNNCEHFTSWCLHGVARSVQVETQRARWQRPLVWLRRIARLVVRGTARSPATLSDLGRV